MKTSSAFFPPESEGTQIVFPCVHSDENAFLPLFLSVKRTSGFFLCNIQRPFFFSLRLILYIGLMPRFPVADENYQKRGLIDEQSNFLRFNLVLSSCIKINSCMLLALP